MLLNFPERGQGQDSKSSEKDTDEANTLDQKSEVQLNERQLPSVTEGRVTIHISSVSSAGGGLSVSLFVANGFSQKVKFKNLPLVLLDSNRQVLAQQTFGGETIDKVDSCSVKACTVHFQPDNVFVQDIPKECEVRFDVRPKRSESIKIQYQSLPEKISENKKQELEGILAKLPPMKHGEVNYSPLYAKITNQDNLLATVIIRNSTNKQIRLARIPLTFLDANQKELARGLFDVKTKTINPFKAILWTFDFGKVLKDRDIDLSSWNINVLR